MHIFLGGDYFHRVSTVNPTAILKVLWLMMIIIPSLGAVVRDWDGNMGATLSSPKLGASSPIFAKTQALDHGLKWCSTIQLPITCIELDYLQLVTKINNK
ncbi:hypothetical protein G4B88_016178 [Cannabis sativa]|uniref:RNase H type-1 domain-containing protein n=1 Tax=Cannabis sativa TaxID=3483 RepID=A0A7J6FN28_CANSA|nr:hypothetical protein G4B88_016178 [Cannabis sativa]